MSYKKKYFLFLIFILILIYVCIILYIHNIITYLSLKIIILLIKNKINFFKMVIDDNTLNNTPNSISSGDFLLLIEELLSN